MVSELAREVVRSTGSKPSSITSTARDLASALTPRTDCGASDLRSRDAAHHQGTVWAWLIGPFIDAWLKVHPGDRRGARKFLEGFVPHLDEGCVGSISEVFDAEPPFTPRGCIAQAWSGAEVLRCFALTADEPPPPTA